MSEYLWHHIRYQPSEGQPRYGLVIVLAWHESTATVLLLDETGDRVLGSVPYLVKIHELGFGRPPEGSLVIAA